MPKRKSIMQIRADTGKPALPHVTINISYISFSVYTKLETISN
ncbi:hypothetical protein [[Clostridium] hylemonae]|uniref:Uncharacterized protein n=1 Tax=[Clostridium] hylemonae DSM 15053 TaxID=553973 RepID=C0C2G3_9FIRM|nr:hypothetical protein [[Clostridium] hylemonae]EEG73587.1 hypothetical protein CLOHYLEM_06269 [[Clostridium] hylemonae DSM 15053]QEK17189.1 hypothetical protein LAJLEIBI_01198 [[Clostridium] hylemonae DSM 15053]